MSSPRERWGQQERDHLAEEIGEEAAAEWISVLSDLATTLDGGTKVVTIWDALRFAVDIRRQEE